MKINNKMKKFLAGNWGKPTKSEQKKNVDVGIFDNEVPKHNKKKKKTKKVYTLPWSVCPFCNERLDEVPAKHDNSVYYVLHIKEYADKCDCGAKRVLDCPACHSETWFKDFIYKHQRNWGCTFTGEKKWASSS